MSKTSLYDDKYIQIFEDKIRFKSWCLPWGKKDVKLSHVKKISEKNMGLFSGDYEYLVQTILEIGFILMLQDLQRKKLLS